MTQLDATLLTKAYGKKKSSRQSRSPTYLYRKDGVLYFRYALTAEQKKHYCQSELRINLRTTFVSEAKKLSRKLYISLESLMSTENNFTALELRKQLSVELQEYYKNNKDQPSYQEIKKDLANKLKQLFATLDKKEELTITEIKDRMRALLQAMVNAADNTFYKPACGFSFMNDELESIPLEDNLKAAQQMILMDIKRAPTPYTIDMYPEIILELLHRRVFSCHELTNSSIPKILTEYDKVQLNFNQIMQARERGDYAFEQSFISPSIDSIFPFSTTSSTTVPTSLSIKLSEFIEKYISTKLKDGQWKEHNVSTHKNRLMAMFSILGDVPVQNISREDLRKFRDTLRNMPPNYMKMSKYNGMSVEEIIASSPQKTYSIKTVNITIEAIASMFEWGVREGLIEKNNAKGLQLKDERQDIELREAFTQEDLHKIFFNKHYILQNFKLPAYYWAPLIGLYTGMRLEEVCQLHCADIQQVGDIWYIDINTKVAPESTEVKLLKNSSAQRQVPLHSTLLEYGLISFVQEVQAAGHERIFPELAKTQSSPKYGKNVGKAFSAYIKKCNITDGKKSFHSLRHTFSHFFKVKNLQNDLFRQVFGHEIPELAARQYGNKFSVEQCYNELICEIDFSKLK